MSHIGKGYDINQTFVIESSDGSTPIFSACTGVYTNEIISCSGDTFIELGTSVIRFVGDVMSNNAVSATTYYGDGSNLTGIYFQDVYVTGGTYNTSSGVASFTNNTGGTFTISGFSTSTATSFTGGTVTGATSFTGGVSANTFSATTYLGLPITQDTFVTGGTYNTSSGIATFTNNTGGTFTVSGFYTGSSISNDTYVTGGTYNDSTGTATFTNNTGGTFNVGGFYTGFTGGNVSGITATTISSNNYFSGSTNLSVLINNVNLSGGTFNKNLGVLTLNKNNGNIQITGFTDFYLTCVTYNNNNVLTFTDNNGQSLSVLFNIFSGVTVNGTSNLNGTINSNNLSGSTNRLVQVSSGGTFSASQQIISAYITSGSTVATLLENDSNWDINGFYVGSGITGTYQGQKHFDLNYFYEAIQDNVFIRLIRG